MTKKITFVVIPPKTSKVFRLQFSAFSLRIIKYFFFLFGLLTVYAVIQYALFVSNQNKYEKLVENARLQNLELNYVFEDLKATASSLQQLNSFDEKIRLLLKQPNSSVDLTNITTETDPSFATNAGNQSFETAVSANQAYTAIEQELKTIKVNFELRKQSFLELKNYIVEEKERLRATPVIKPVRSGYLTSPFGLRSDPFTGAAKMHYGIDWAFLPYTPIFATADGRVERSYYSVSYGNTVIIDHGQDMKTLYAHLAKREVRSGQRIKRGQVIGRMGNTGNRSTATHLHYEVIYKNKPVNPGRFLLEDLPPATSLFTVEF